MSGVPTSNIVTLRRAAVYSDQMLPFDIALVAQNEMGQAAWEETTRVLNISCVLELKE